LSKPIIGDKSLADKPTITERSSEYNQLIQQLKAELEASNVRARDIALRIYQQGLRDGLSNEEMRTDIETVLAGMVKYRQLMYVLPQELKRSGGYDSKPRIAMTAIQTEAKAAMEAKRKFSEPTQVKQLAIDSISETVTVVSPSVTEDVTAIENIAGAVDEQVYSNEDIDHESDQSEIYDLAKNYEIEHIVNYDRSHLIKIAKYQHDRMTKDNELIQQLKQQNQELSNKLVNAIPSPIDEQQIQLLKLENEGLRNELDRRSKRDHDLIEAVMRLGNQVKQAGLVPVATLSLPSAAET
jgi:hypothetical protein